MASGTGALQPKGAALGGRGLETPLTASSVGVFLDALRTALVARSGLSGVNVFTGPVGPEDAGKEAIILIGAELTETPEALGNFARFEEYDISGEVVTFAGGKGEATIKSARDRALAITHEVEDLAKDNDDLDLVIGWEITARTLEQGYATEDLGHWCRIGFTIHVQHEYVPA